MNTENQAHLLSRCLLASGLLLTVAACGSNVDEAVCELGSLQVSAMAMLSGDNGRGGTLELEGKATVTVGDLIGLAFECQKVETITANPWDIRVFCTITEQS